MKKRNENINKTENHKEYFDCIAANILLNTEQSQKSVKDKHIHVECEQIVFNHPHSNLPTILSRRNLQGIDVVQLFNLLDLEDTCVHTSAGNIMEYIDNHTVTGYKFSTTSDLVTSVLIRVTHKEDQFNIVWSSESNIISYKSEDEYKVKDLIAAAR